MMYLNVINLSNLPNDMILEIAKFLRLNGIRNFRQICWRFYKYDGLEEILSLKLRFMTVKNPEEIPIDFIERHPKCLANYTIVGSILFSEDFLDRHIDHMNIWKLSSAQKLSENFIRRHADKLDWYWISGKQKLSEEFIEEFAEKVNWEEIGWYQKLSNEFVEKHKTKKKLIKSWASRHLK